MPFDAGMLAAAVGELNGSVIGARAEKIIQPSRDEVVIFLRGNAGSFRLLVNAGPNCPRIGLTEMSSDGPEKPPMFCVVLRRHLAGSRLMSAKQLGFERAAVLSFAARDELGFDCEKRLIAEVMGKYSNLILTDGEGKVINAMRLVDFTTSSKRQVLPGMSYELPPKQDKLDPMTEDGAGFLAAIAGSPDERAAEKIITASYLGISSAVAREIVFRATRHTDTPLRYCDREVLCRGFLSVFENIKKGKFEPTLVVLDGKPTEYGFMPLTQYTGAEMRRFDSAGGLLDAYYGERDREQRQHQRASDILRLLTTAESRIRKKLDLQRGELADCEKGVFYKNCGDLITANIFRLSRGDKKVELVDYSAENPDGSYKTVEVELDSRLTPAANAQRYYKKYAKTKTAETELTKQIKLGETELEYIYSVFDALSRAETVADLAEIREELYTTGYASKVKAAAKPKKPAKPTIASLVTSGGYTVYYGKNNIQNEYITFKLAAKDDWWFHAKGTQGAHVLMVCNGEEPDAKDFTEAAEIAARFSRFSGGEKVEVDYTKAKNVKKPANGKPGMVIYHTNYSCAVLRKPEDKS